MKFNDMTDKFSVAQCMGEHNISDEDWDRAPKSVLVALRLVTNQRDALVHLAVKAVNVVEKS